METITAIFGGVAATSALLAFASAWGVMGFLGFCAILTAAALLAGSGSRDK